MAGHDPDLPFFEWAFGLLASFFVAGYGHLFTRIGQETDARRQGNRDGNEAMTEADTKVWNALEAHRQEFQNFRAIMVETAVKRNDLRADLRDMEDRLRQAQREMENRLVMMLKLPQQDRAP